MLRFWRTDVMTELCISILESEEEGHGHELIRVYILRTEYRNSYSLVV